MVDWVSFQFLTFVAAAINADTLNAEINLLNSLNIIFKLPLSLSLTG
jgi:hypothetical protein